MSVNQRTPAQLARGFFGFCQVFHETKDYLLAMVRRDVELSGPKQRALTVPSNPHVSCSSISNRILIRARFLPLDEKPGACISRNAGRERLEASGVR